MRKLIFSAIGLMMITAAFAQFKVDADFRTRGEVRNGYITPALESNTAASFVSQRSRINFSFAKEKFSMKFGIQDVRIWGEDDLYTTTGAFGDTGSLMASEAWMKYNFTDSASIKVGRQVFAYDEQRLLSGRDWNQYGLFYDAALLSYLKNNWQFDLGLSFNNTAENQYDIEFPSDKNRIQTLNFLYAKNKLSDKSNISALVLATGMNDADDANNIHQMFTIGLNYNQNIGKLKTHLEGYYQTGENETGMDKDAYFLTASVDYPITKSVTIGAGYDYFSGEDGSNTDADYATTDHTFDILYGARFKYSGNMNQFLMMGKPWDAGGLQDINANLTYKMNKKHSIKADFHAFMLSSDYADPTNTSGSFVALDKNLGWELDTYYNYKFNSYSKLSLGISYLNPTDELYIIKNMNPDDMGTNLFGWVSIQFTPELFNSSKN